MTVLKGQYNKHGATKPTAEGHVLATGDDEVHAKSISVTLIFTKHASRAAIKEAATVKWIYHLYTVIHASRRCAGGG